MGFFPIILNLDQVHIMVIGNGRQTLRRLVQLDEALPKSLQVFADQPIAELRRIAADRLIERLPLGSDFRGAIAYIGDFEKNQAMEFVAFAHAANMLANVEDYLEGCDFHSPSMVRRGDLLLTVSTAGQSPGLAVQIRGKLESQFGSEWNGRLAELAAQRKEWQRQQLGYSEICRLTEEWIKARGWLE